MSWAFLIPAGIFIVVLVVFVAVLFNRRDRAVEPDANTGRCDCSACREARENGEMP